jgi:hypothetical protein
MLDDCPVTLTCILLASALSILLTGYVQRACWWCDLFSGVSISDVGQVHGLGYANPRRQVDDEAAPDRWLPVRRDSL